MKNLNTIDAIIFDLGGVILNLDYNLTVKAFQKHIKNMQDDAFLGKKAQLHFFNQYEIGKITTENFIKEFNTHYETKLEQAEFEKCWNAMILDIPKERIELLKRLRKEGKQVFLLSNINEIHERAVLERYEVLKDETPFFDLFNKAYYSHHIGMRKPDTEIFQFVLSEQKLAPEKTLFIDDSIQHIEGASQLGIAVKHLTRGNSIESIFNN
jgi:epoxide hydrolase-like predicted phosphatase